MTEICGTAMPGIRPRREALGLAQTYCARTIGVSRAAYANWEAGRAIPGAQFLPAIALMLRCTIEELYIDPEGGADNVKLECNP